MDDRRDQEDARGPNRVLELTGVESRQEDGQQEPSGNRCRQTDRQPDPRCALDGPAKTVDIAFGRLRACSGNSKSRSGEVARLATVRGNNATEKMPTVPAPASDPKITGTADRWAPWTLDETLEKMPNERSFPSHSRAPSCGSARSHLLHPTRQARPP